MRKYPGGGGYIIPLRLTLGEALSYRGKFSRGNIFMVFSNCDLLVQSQTIKLKVHG